MTESRRWVSRRRNPYRPRVLPLWLTEAFAVAGLVVFCAVAVYIMPLALDVMIAVRP